MVSSATGKSDGVESRMKTEDVSMPPQSVSPHASSMSLQCSSSPDIVQEEIDPRDYSSSVFESDGGNGEHADEDCGGSDVAYRLESVRLLSSDELEDLPTSVRDDPHKKRPVGLLE